LSLDLAQRYLRTASSNSGRAGAAFDRSLRRRANVRSIHPIKRLAYHSFFTAVSATPHDGTAFWVMMVFSALIFTDAICSGMS
jgi:hypothetical protein